MLNESVIQAKLPLHLLRSSSPHRGWWTKCKYSNKVPLLHRPRSLSLLGCRLRTSIVLSLLDHGDRGDFDSQRSSGKRQRESRVSAGDVTFPFLRHFNMDDGVMEIKSISSHLGPSFLVVGTPEKRVIHKEALSIWLYQHIIEIINVIKGRSTRSSNH